MKKQLNQRVQKWRRIAVAAATLAVIPAVLAGCGSSSGNSGGKTQSDEISAAKAANEKNEAEVTTIGDLEPLKAKPESGKLFIWMNCDFPICKVQTDGARAAAEAAGWEFKSLNYSLADPASGVAALKQALQYKPVAVGVTGLQKAQFASVIPAYEEADVPIINGYSDGTPTGPIIATYYGENYCTDQGKRAANWFIADSNGKGKGLVAEIAEVPCLKAQTDEFQKYVEEHCGGCSLTALPVSIADASGGKLASAVRGALLKDKTTTYVHVPLSNFTAGLPAALQAAGLADKVKVYAPGGSAPDIAALKQGKFAALAQINSAMDGWRAVDGALRYDQEMSQPSDDVLPPTRVLTADTPNLKETDYLQEPADYEDQFKKLWLVN